MSLPGLYLVSGSSAHDAMRDRECRVVVAGGWIVDDEDRVLLLHRNTADLRQWETPGGKVEEGESPAQAAVRELAEELDVCAVVVGDLGWHDFNSGPARLRYALFKMRIESGNPQPVESRFDQVAFFTLAGLFEMRPQLSPNVTTILSIYGPKLLTHSAPIPKR